MPKQIVVDQIEVTANGTIQIRMHKLSSDGDLIGNHRTAIEPNGDVDAQMGAVNAHMTAEGFSPITADDISRVKTIAQAAWVCLPVAP